MGNFIQKQPQEFSSVFNEIDKGWMLVTAGDQSGFNTMTASWGGVGILWNRPVAFVFIRPQRYTKEYVDRSDKFSLSFFDGYREALTLCGTKSGRDLDKVKAAGLTPVFDEGTVYFEQSSKVLVCKKLYRQPLEEKSFIQPDFAKQYYNGDLHDMYIAEIEKLLVKAK